MDELNAALLPDALSLPGQRHGLAADSDISPEGVDLSLIRWMLSLTPRQRLDVLQGFVNSVSVLHRGTHP
jgi:hypothetical protein